MINLKLTQEQAEQLAKILDSATQGVQNASVTVPLYNLLMQAAQDSLGGEGETVPEVSGQVSDNAEPSA